MKITIVIPVYNEGERFSLVLEKLHMYDEVIVIDDGSAKPVGEGKTFPSNVRLLRNEENRGYLYSIKRGIRDASGDIVVTMDGDGEHRPEDVERLLEPIVAGECDLVFGKRPNIARPSERLLLGVANRMTGDRIEDAGTGFRAMRADGARKLEFGGKCTCGLLHLEAKAKGMRICEKEVDLPIVDKPRRIAWEHFTQLFIVIGYYLRNLTRIKRPDAQSL